MSTPTAIPVAVLLGGGVESTHVVRTFLAAGQAVIPVHVRCGLVWDDCESLFVQRFCGANASPLLHPLLEFQVPLQEFLPAHWATTGIDVPRAGDQTSNLEIPLRNLLLLSLAVHRLRHLPEISLALGTTADNCFRDGSRAYFDRCEELLSIEADRPVRILTPLIHLQKPQIIREAERQTLALSFSCVEPRQDVHCGTCIKCGKRQAAFRAAGVDDPTVYAQPFSAKTAPGDSSY